MDEGRGPSSLWRNRPPSHWPQLRTQPQRQCRASPETTASGDCPQVISGWIRHIPQWRRGSSAGVGKFLRGMRLCAATGHPAACRLLAISSPPGVGRRFRAKRVERHSEEASASGALPRNSFSYFSWVLRWTGRSVEADREHRQTKDCGHVQRHTLEGAAGWSAA